MQQRRVDHWLDEHLLELGSIDDVASHHLIIDRDRNVAFVLPAQQARAIVGCQRFDPADFFDAW